MLYVLYLGFWLIALTFTAAMAAIGGRTERWAASMMFAAAVFTPFIGGLQNSRWRAPQLGVLAVDMVLLAALLTLALRSSRFWPLTLTSLQLLAVMTHPALWIDRTILPFGYAFMQGFWAYPMMAVVTLGAWRGRRRSSGNSEGSDDQLAGTAREM
jgi:hypothetical protein